MYFYYLKTADEQTMKQVLVDAGVASVQDSTVSPIGSNSFDLIGTHYELTGGTAEDPVYTAIDGFHANVVTTSPVVWPAGVYQNAANAPWRGWGGTPASAPDSWLESISAKRYEREVAGVVWNSHIIATDRESQSKLDSERAAAQDGIRVENSVWKCLDIAAGQIVFRPTTNLEINEITAKVYAYISQCFAKEGELFAAYQAGTITAEQLETGWPSRNV